MIWNTSTPLVCVERLAPPPPGSCSSSEVFFLGIAIPGFTPHGTIANGTIHLEIGQFRRGRQEYNERANILRQGGKIVALHFEGIQKGAGLISTGNRARQAIVSNMKEFEAAIAQARGITVGNTTGQGIVIEKQVSEMQHAGRTLRPIHGQTTIEVIV